MNNSKLHLKYLASLVKGEAKEHADGPPSLHSMYVELNKLAGMYWIVCSCFLLDRMQPGLGVVDRLREKFNQQLSSALQSGVVFDELGGPLRALSFVQLVEFLTENSDEKNSIFDLHVRPQLRDFLGKYMKGRIEESLPFWFDMRGVYCLCAMLKLTGLLDELTEDQRTVLIEYIGRSQVILGGFGARPQSEAHGGYTFCAVSSLRILNAEIPNKQRLTVWLKQRLAEANGRVGKPRDSCYLWWVGATLVNIGCDSIVNENRDRIERFISVNCFCPDTGGFSKYPSIPVDDNSVHGKQDPDLFHTFLGISSHALLKGCINPLTALPLYV